MKFIEPYMVLLQRNKKAIYKRLLELSEAHIDRIQEVDPEMMEEEEHVKTVYEYYKQATDKDNPIRVALDLDDEMHGQLISDI